MEGQQRLCCLLACQSFSSVYNKRAGCAAGDAHASHTGIRTTRDCIVQHNAALRGEWRYGTLPDLQCHAVVFTACWVSAVCVELLHARVTSAWAPADSAVVGTT